MEIVNKVDASGIVTLNLEELYPQGERVVFDIKDLLFQGLILREKEFREYLKQEDWSRFKDKYVAIVCSSDAIVPTWAYMLLALQLQPFVKKTVFGSLETLEAVIFNEAIQKIEPQSYQDTRVVIKGCSHIPVSIAAYVEIANRIKPYAKSIMYGEPCSTVPLYKKAKL